MKNIKEILILILLLLLYTFETVFSQTQTPETGATNPLELPNIIIEGKEQLNVKSGIKQSPDNPLPMTKSELDSINTFEKQQSLLLPPKPLPNSIMEKKGRKGFIRGEFGRYISPLFEGALSSDIGEDADLYANAGLDISGDHIDNSKYSKGFLKFLSNYTAPEKYLIFGGSKTLMGINFNNWNYKLYSVQEPPSRSMSDLDIFIDSKGKYDGYEFSTGASFNTFNISDDYLSEVKDGSDNALNGYIQITGLWEGFESGVEGELDIRSVNGKGADYFRASGMMKYFSNEITILGKGGIERATTTTDIGRTGLYFDFNIEYRVNELFTLKGLLTSKFERNNLFSFFKINPYVAPNIDIDFDYKRQLKAIIYFHPNDRMFLSSGFYFGTGSRTPYFVSLNGDFTVLYGESQNLGLFLEGENNFTENDNVNCNLSVDRLILKSNQELLPYAPVLKFSINYRRKWVESFGTIIGFYYIGERNIFSQNNDVLNSYFDLRLDINYSFSKDLTIYFKMANMLNSDIYVWQGYKERGIYFSVGVLWLF